MSATRLFCAISIATCSCSSAVPSAQGDAAPDVEASDAQPPPCAPQLPHPTWANPYAAWSRGLPTDASFFPIAVWLQAPSHITEYANIGIDIYLGNSASVDPLTTSDLASLKTNGLFAVVGQDSLGRSNIDDPTIVGWWLADEPDNAQPNGSNGYGPPIPRSTIVSECNAFKTADPTRPVYLGLGEGVAYDAYEGRGSNPPPESDYVPGSDIVGFDIYPYNNCGGDSNAQVRCNEFWLNAFGVDRLHAWSNHGQAVWSDFETTVIASGTTSGPTPDETVSEVWLALIHGANGVIYFTDSWTPSFREDAIFEYPAMVTAVTTLNQTIKLLAPVLNSASIPSLVSVATTNAAVTIDVMAKTSDTTLYVFAATSRAGETTGTFTVNGLGGMVTAAVVGENRTIVVAGGQFTDAFAANGVHIYKIDVSTQCR